jgi:hypothetical protein
VSKALFWLGLIYGTIKIVSVVLAANPGFRRTEVRLRDRLRAGEPWLLVVAAAIAVPAAYGTDWYAHRHFTDMFTDASTCYARIMALDSAPEFIRGVDGYRVYERVSEYRNVSLDAAAQLGVSREQAIATLASKVASLTKRYAARKGQNTTMHSEVAAAKRCLFPPGPSPNA